METKLVLWEILNIVLKIGAIVWLFFLCKWIYSIHINTKRIAGILLNPRNRGDKFYRRPDAQHNYLSAKDKKKRRPVSRRFLTNK